MLDGQTFTYKAIDTHTAGGITVPDEYYCKMMPSGMAPHYLTLKVCIDIVFHLFILTNYRQARLLYYCVILMLKKESAMVVGWW